MARRPPPPTITPSLLTKGWSAPAGGRVRLATPDDAEDVRRLQLLVDGDVQEDKSFADLLADDKLGVFLEPSLTARGEPAQKVLLRQVAEHADAGRWTELGLGVSFVLVACDRQGDVVGALVATAAKSLLEGALLQGIDPRMAIMVPVAVLKLRVLAVQEQARGLGLGAALLKRAGQLTDTLGFFLFYGQVDASDEGLARFYSRCGWQVHAPGESVSLSDRLRLPLGVTPQDGELLISRWR